VLSKELVPLATDLSFAKRCVRAFGVQPVRVLVWDGGGEGEGQGKGKGEGGRESEGGGKGD